MARSKYGNKTAYADGYRFDSLAEYHRYMELKLLETAGELSDLRVHPRYLLQEGFRYKGKTERPIYYEADFEYLDTETSTRVVEDVKGKRTSVYTLKRKLFLAKHRHFDFREVAA